MPKLSPEERAERKRQRVEQHEEFLREIAAIRLGLPEGMGKRDTVHLKIECRRCHHAGDLILTMERIARNPKLRCSQCGAKQKV